MIKKLPFNEKTKSKIINEQQALGFTLFEVQLHTDGKYLLFTNGDIPEPVQSLTIAEEIALLKSKLSVLETDVTTLKQAKEAVK